MTAELELASCAGKPAVESACWRRYPQDRQYRSTRKAQSCTELIHRMAANTSLPKWSRCGNVLLTDERHAASWKRDPNDQPIRPAPTRARVTKATVAQGREP